MKDIKRWLPGAIVSMLLIAAILYFVDLRAMVDAIRKANYALLAVAFPLGFVWIFIRSIVWRTLLRNRASLRDVFWTIGEGYLLNNFLPFRLGEVGRAFLLSRKSGMQFMEILPTIVIERVMDLGYTAIIFLAALPFVVGAKGAERVGSLVGLVVLAGFIILYLLARYNRWALDVFHKLSARWPALQKVGGNFLEAFFAGLGVLTDGWLFLRFLFWMTLNWVVAIFNYYLIIRAFFPGALGGAITLLTGDQSTALAVALTVRLYNYINSGVIGGIGLVREGQTLSGVYDQLKRFRSKESVENTK